MKVGAKMTDIAVNGLVAILDFGAGMLITAVVAWLLKYDIEIWHLAVGGLLALLPDIDVIWPILFSDGIAFNHRTSIMHRPLVVIPIAVAIAGLFFGKFWALIAGCCVLWHFVHDSPPLNDGRIDWLWPFEGKRTLTPDYRAPEFHQKWLRDWKGPTVRSSLELSAGLICIGLALWVQTGTYKLSVLAAGVGALGIATVWYFARVYA